MKKYNIANIIYHDTPTFPDTPVIDFKIQTLDDEGETVTLITNDEFRVLLMQKYFSFYIQTPSFYDTEAKEHVELVQNLDSAIVYLGNVFRVWADSRKHGFMKLYEALMSDYKPWVNYDKTIHSTTEYSGSETNELTKTGSEQNSMNNAEVSSIIKKTAYDEDDYLDNTKTTTPAHIDTDTLSFTNRKDTDVKSFNNRTDTYDYTEYGNIGVKSTQEIIMTSFTLTNLEDLKNYIVNYFVHENLIQ